MGGADEKEEDVKHTFMHGDEVESVAYSPDGTHIVSGSFDKSVRIWNIDSGLEVKSFMHDDWVCSVEYSPIYRLGDVYV